MKKETKIWERNQGTGKKTRIWERNKGIGKKTWYGETRILGRNQRYRKEIKDMGKKSKIWEKNQGFGNEHKDMEMKTKIWESCIAGIKVRGEGALFNL